MMIEIGNAQIVGKRDNQEDYFATVAIEDGMLCVVADGMGGYEGGEVASQIVVKYFIEYCKKHIENNNIKQIFLEATHFANKQLEIEKEKTPSLDEMGATLIAIYVIDSTLYWVSVGDSLLLKYNKSLQRLNADHSVAGELQEQVNGGEITQDQADAKPNRHALTSALTGYEIPHIDFSQIAIETDDKFLLASDGILTLDNQLIAKAFSSSTTPQELCDGLMELVKKKDLKNQDNTTVVSIYKQQKKNTTEISNTTQVKAPRTGFLITIIIFLLLVIVSILYYDKVKTIVDNLVMQNTLKTEKKVVVKDKNQTTLPTLQRKTDTNKTK